MGFEKSKEGKTMKNLHRNIKLLIGHNKLATVDQLEDIGTIGQLI